jgi:four helix bundle protein
MQKDFRRLKIWQESMKLAVLIYDLTVGFPDNEKFGLVVQMRKCAVSIPSNIAEGAGRGTNPQFAQFLSIAQGSAFELETQILLAEKMKLVTSEQIKDVLEKLHYIQKMNFNLKKSLTLNKN